MIDYKFYCTNLGVWREQFNGDPTIATLVDTVRDISRRLNNVNIQMSYVDSDGDRIGLSRDEDVRLMVRVLHSTPETAFAMRKIHVNFTQNASQVYMFRLVKNMSDFAEVGLYPGVTVLQRWKFRNETSSELPQHFSIFHTSKNGTIPLTLRKETVLPIEFMNCVKEKNANGEVVSTEFEVHLLIESPNQPGFYPNFWKLKNPETQKNVNPELKFGVQVVKRPGQKEIDAFSLSRRVDHILRCGSRTWNEDYSREDLEKIVMKHHGDLDATFAEIQSVYLELNS